MAFLGDLPRLPPVRLLIPCSPACLCRISLSGIKGHTNLGPSLRATLCLGPRFHILVCMLLLDILFLSAHTEALYWFENGLETFSCLPFGPRLQKQLDPRVVQILDPHVS